jgi:hypothetical protein
MSKVIFLDFDGVLLTDDQTQQQVNRSLTTQNYLKTVSFDPTAVANVNRLIESTGAQLVLSTSWADGNSFSSLANCLMRNRIDPGNIWEYDDPSQGSWMTPRSSNSNRAQEIATWLESHPEVSDWCAIDDRSEIDQLGSRAVKTDPRKGFDNSALAQALKILR